MAAVIQPQHTPVRPERPRFTVIEGGRSDAGRRQRRVYLRRRVLVLIVLAALLWAGASMIGGILGGGVEAPSARTAATSRYVVAPGDTLWDVAVGLHVDGDVRDVVDRLAELNGDRLIPGQVLEIPADLTA